jgi:hypothetical protein
MSTRPKVGDFDDAVDVLEENLNAIKFIAETLLALDDGPPKNVLDYLGIRLREHRDEAMDAFRRICGLHGYGKESGGDEDAEKGGAVCPPTMNCWRPSAGWPPCAE